MLPPTGTSDGGGYLVTEETTTSERNDAPSIQTGIHAGFIGILLEESEDAIQQRGAPSNGN